MKVYITPAGKTALRNDNFLKSAKEAFDFDIALLLTSADRVNMMLNKYSDYAVGILPVSEELATEFDYMQTIRRVLFKVFSLPEPPTEVIINSSGGTEKMSCIIKDIGDILALANVNLKKVWGMFNVETESVFFSSKPPIDAKQELENVLKSVEEFNETTAISLDQEGDQRE